jgi:ribose transport system permease protein
MMKFLRLKERAWTIGITILFLVLAYWRASQLPRFGSYEIKTILLGVLPIALLAMGQSIIIIGGGINLALGPEAALINCITAKYANGSGFSKTLFIVILGLLVSIVVGAITGWIISTSGIADIVVTLATSFIIIGISMFILPNPGGGANGDFAHLISGKGNSFLSPLLTFLIPYLFIWIPLYRSRSGIAMFAMGSSQDAAFLSGVDVKRTRIKLYAVGGLFAGLSGITLTCITLSASAIATISTTATLNSVAAAVLGGIALTGGVGGLLGPALASLVIYFIPVIMLGYGIDPAYSQMIQGALTVLVVMAGGFLRERTKRSA